MLIFPPLILQFQSFEEFISIMQQLSLTLAVGEAVSDVI